MTPRFAGERDLQALLLLNRTPGIGMRGLAPFFEEKKSPSEVLEIIQREGRPSWKEALDQTLRIFDPAKEISQAEERGVQLISFENPSYPSLLAESSDPPLLLYVLGDLIESDEAACAIVGSRHPSLYGLEQTKRFSRRLSELGITIVSGFARGIDRQAHEAALEVSYGRTIAVLGSGLDVIYPKEHQELYEEIRQRGAIISEFSFGTPPLSENFPKRNRIIAGLSLGVLVVEAHSRSGSLITARLAAEEGREVFALPGRVDQLGSRGTHILIREGAGLVESPEEIFDALSPQLFSLVPARAPLLDLEPEEKEFLELFEERALSPGEIIRQEGLGIWQVNAFLTQLEIKGVLKKRLDGRYERA